MLSLLFIAGWMYPPFLNVKAYNFSISGVMYATGAFYLWLSISEKEVSWGLLCFICFLMFSTIGLIYLLRGCMYPL